jgi:predicted TIM-barrel fold metal-dependent hydrolase
MIDGVPVIDAIVHSYDLGPENYKNRWAEPVGELLWGAMYGASPPGYRLPKEQYIRDWGVEEVANLSFVESQADIAVQHVLVQGAFHDDLVSFRKIREIHERWPDRFIVYAGVDPTRGEAALEELERQVELLGGAAGLKLYPNSWDSDEEVIDWLMDDPEIAYPVFARAQELGIKVVAVHKALPLGPLPMKAYAVDDIDRAAMDFPDLNFEIVHGGMAFLEETAWQLTRFPNVFVNLEVTTSLVVHRPLAFQHALATMLEPMPHLNIEKIIWGTGAMCYHPQPHVEAFYNDFQFDEATIARYGLAPLDREAKRKILSGNYASMQGLDLELRLARIKGDEFDQRRRGDDVAAPWSTTRSAGHAE